MPDPRTGHWWRPVRVEDTYKPPGHACHDLPSFGRLTRQANARRHRMHSLAWAYASTEAVASDLPAFRANEESHLDVEDACPKTDAGLRVMCSAQWRDFD